MQKTKRFSLVITTSENEAISFLADLEGGLSKAALIRRLIRKAAKENNVWGKVYKQDIFSTLRNDNVHK